MNRTTEIADPLRRRVALVVFLGSAAAVLLGRVHLGFGLAAALVTALLFSYLLARELSPLRRRLASMTGRPERVPTPGEMAELLEREAERESENREALRTERDDLVDILHATANGLVLLDEDDRVQLVNDAARRMLGTPTDPLGMRLPEIVRNLDFLQAVARARRGGTVEPQRIEVHTGTGIRSLRVWASRLQGRGTGRRVVVVLDDISDVQHLERVRTDFVANVTHEMRSPLTAIVGFAETMAEESDTFSPISQRGLQRILANAQRLQNIIDDLVRLSRLEHASDTDREEVDPTELVTRVCEPYREACADRGQVFALETSDLPAKLPLDPELLAQALSNLLDNAVKYTPEGGHVTVRARIADGALRIDVVDDGPGIPKEHQQRIFERFYRVDSARSRAIGGTGLGLAIVKHAAALHGGQVTLESAPGRGTTFSLRLPVEESA
ncbi:MAG: ATP-binding protein [Planctomycetota bacterium]